MSLDQDSELWTALDEIVVRIRALGHPASFDGQTYSAIFMIPDGEGVLAALGEWSVSWCSATRPWPARFVRSSFAEVDHTDQAVALSDAQLALRLPTPNLVWVEVLSDCSKARIKWPSWRGCSRSTRGSTV